MKPTGALALLAILSVTVTGCEATKKKVVAHLPTMGIFSITLDNRIGPVAIAEPKRRLTKDLGAGVAARIDGRRRRLYPQVGIYVAYPPNPPKGKQTVAALVITRSARYKTPSQVGVGSTLRQLRTDIKVRCYGGSSVSTLDTCQHERANTNLPFTVFNIDPTTKRVTQIAIVPGGD